MDNFYYICNGWLKTRRYKRKLLYALWTKQYNVPCTYPNIVHTYRNKKYLCVRQYLSLYKSGETAEMSYQ